MKNERIVGKALAEVLPETDKWWFQIPHLLQLNLILLVPLISSSVAGYDGSLMNGLQSLQQVMSSFLSGCRLLIVCSGKTTSAIRPEPC